MADSSKSAIRFLKSETSKWKLVSLGLLLILLGNSFKFLFVNINVHELLANIGGLVLFTGIMQWLFDEESREDLVGSVRRSISEFMTSKDHLFGAGIQECLTDSKGIAGQEWASILVEANTLIIGVQYSDGMVVRMEDMIRRRVDANKATKILHVDPDSDAATYLKGWMGHSVDVANKVQIMQGVVASKFNSSELVTCVSHNCVLRYSFIFTEFGVWVTFMTNTSTYLPVVPSIFVKHSTPLYKFFKSDIEKMGKVDGEK